MNEIEAAAICRALGDANRLRIVGLLTGGERCACVLLEHFDITQPTLSHHMRVLCECGLIETRREGRWAHYSLNCRTLAAFREYIAALDCGKDRCGGI